MEYYYKITKIRFGTVPKRPEPFATTVYRRAQLLLFYFETRGNFFLKLREVIIIIIIIQ